ncbi:hypothetical protein J1614_009024 [Plenodomus biglobosus]|nr:hypothetical protein J1614_009024 [Plenodomus biglobosus]
MWGATEDRTLRKRRRYRIATVRYKRTAHVTAPPSGAPSPNHPTFAKPSPNTQVVPVVPL